MLHSRLLLVVMLWIGIIGLGSGPGPAQAQCEPGTPDCPVTPAPLRSDCPPGSHPAGLNDCEVDGSGPLRGLKVSGAGEVITGLADFNWLNAD